MQLADEAVVKEKTHFENIYGSDKADECVKRLKKLLEKYDLSYTERPDECDLWTHKDLVLITYADMIRSDLPHDETNLVILHRFLHEYLHGLITTVHLLPFYPSSSDDGFSVIDYKEVDAQTGSWADIEEFAREFRLMADLVINHTSRYSQWFRKFLRREEPYRNYYIEVDREMDLSTVVRPRNSPLAVPVHTSTGESLVWATFSEDQIDLDFSNTDVLFEILDVIFFYVKKGIRVIRLDAVAYLWKNNGTSCIHQPQTHEIIKLIRTLVDHYIPDVTLITETNVPHKENISYFGNGDEAHLVYQFSLPPLLLHAILTENASYLTEWAVSLKELPPGCTYFNFTSSHDGIGVRPLEGLVPNSEFDELVNGVLKRGGFISYKNDTGSKQSPYELNITYFDAFKNLNGHEETQEKRYFCSQILMMSMKGVPGIYFHNLTGTRNFLDGVQLTGRYRSINRKKWNYEELQEELADKRSLTSRVFNRYTQLIKIRNHHTAFHPMGAQNVLDLGSSLFCIIREAPDKNERIMVVANVTGENIKMDAAGNENLPVTRRAYKDLLTNSVKINDGKISLGPYDACWFLI